MLMPMFSNYIAAGSVYVFYDSFTDDDAVAIEDHDPEIDDVGTGWEDTTTPNYEILSNRLHRTANNNKNGPIADTGLSDCILRMGFGSNTTANVKDITPRNTRRGAADEPSWSVAFNVGSFLIFEVSTARDSVSDTMPNSGELIVALDGTGIDGELGAFSVSYSSSINQTVTEHGCAVYTGADDAEEPLYFSAEPLP